MKQFPYGYDQAGNRTSEQIDLGVTGANYNNVNELTNTIGGGPVRFVGHLDEPGTVLIGTNAAAMGLQSTSFVGFAQTTLGTNVVTITATDYSSNSRTNRYQVVITNNSVARTLTYDLNGNETSVVTASSTNTYEWDAADRLVAINSGINRSEFTYDGLGRRVRIVEKANGVAQNTNLFLWCGTELCEQRDSTGGTVTKRFFARGEQINGTNYYFTRDHLGSVREMTDGTGAIRARYEYDPYGRRTKAQGDLDSDFAFTGHYYHATSGLYLTLYRAYDTEAGRWLSRDPINEDRGLNLYDYVLNNPVSSIDPYGLLTAVVVGGPSPADAQNSSGNPFGHAAIAFSGRGIYSFGTPEDFGTSFTDFLNVQAEYRDSTVYILNTTPEQESAMIAYLENVQQERPNLGRYPDNCAGRTTGALKEAGAAPPGLTEMPHSDSFSLGDNVNGYWPSGIGDALKDAGALQISVPKGTTLPPHLLTGFNPRK